MKKIYQILYVIFMLTGWFISAPAQDNRQIADEITDSIISRYNRNDYKGIYQLADTAFSNHITFAQLDGFLRTNRNSGDILKTIFLSETNGKFSYLLQGQSRDMKMSLQVTPAKKFTGFGLLNVIPELLDKPIQVKTDNPLLTPLQRSVDSIARAYFRNPNARSLSIGLIKNGQRYVFNYGEVKKGTGVLPSSQTTYEIGSITKTFTGTLLAQAIIEKKVSLNDDIRKYLPGKYPNLSFNGKPLTLQDLANHTSGLPGLPDDMGNQVPFNPLNPEHNYSSAQFEAALQRVKIEILPGSKYNYSNWGVALLGNILEGIFKQSYASLIKKYITKPFGMKDTRYNQTALQSVQTAVPYGENGLEVPFQEEGVIGPAGGIHASMNDMLNYLDQQIKETYPAVKLSHQPTAGNVGLCWGIRNVNGLRDIQHNGSTIGSLSHISAFLELGSGCVILSNQKSNLNPVISSIQKIVMRKDLF
ncbi:serine hydrolase domain-containing protein [Pedobacter metabolipauper]|uniref:CubicO group peptidase (Beta-lactamase class C family) n=1 Tax=Pedobacter metabolipauper TaxID=425513 RepID=A0A4R6SXQ7_9SPHI|nr:serine hydrolase domain-containing protein [Pedobacter metabolipauper]TDQ11176.1 CubicO group peptidase (beta-lactamase class C family) [Pedobacter metabolipauper]